MLCEYGCNQEGKYQLKSGKWCCSTNFNKCPAIRKKNSEANKNRLKIKRQTKPFISNFIKYNLLHPHGWNKGLTKETDDRVKKISDTLSKKYKNHELIPGFKGKHHTIESKIKIGKNGGYKKGCGRGKKGWYKGYWCDSSWELAFILYNIDHNIKFKQNKNFFNYEINGKIRKYYPDFILEDGTYIEIKGYQSKLDDIKFKNFPKENKLKIINFNSDSKILDYVIEKYGKNFIELYDDYKHIETKIPCPKCGNLMLKTSKLCSLCRRKISKKPNKEILIKQLIENNLSKVAKLYNVSHTTIKRWYKQDNINYKDIKENKRKNKLYGTVADSVKAGC